LIDWSHAITAAAEVATILGGIALVGAYLRKLRTNDLAHLDMKLDATHETTMRIEAKVDDHLTWHSENPRIIEVERRVETTVHKTLPGS
jgi:hypothetical protein